jgi:energy-converting hydrogenase A subunit R
MAEHQRSLLIAFDLEGPLSTQDNAYEVMGLIEDGYELFERISRYDDLLTLEGREGYEPGDTLSLILPFLIAHGITEQHIADVSKRATIVPGAKECVNELRSKGHKVVIISTSYEPHALNIANQLGVPKEDVRCTPAPLERIADELKSATADEIQYLLTWQKRILEIPLDDDDLLKAELDRFYWHELKAREIGKALSSIKVVGGGRKVDALISFVEKCDVRMSDVVAIGDSITDYKMLQVVRDSGGLAVVFNGNQYALPYGTVSVAADNLLPILPLVDAFSSGGLEGAKEFVMTAPKTEEGPIYHWLVDGENLEEVLSIHKRFREILRGRAAKLG